jgi:dTDP-4-amino-4,6-dideoxygalactose transaminase
MVDMDPLLEIARAHDLDVIEDAAQAHGASYRGRRAGSLGRLATFSFYPGKNLGAYGDAGAIVTSDAAAAAWLRKARNHGRATKYTHDFEGRNSRMDAIQGGVLSVKLRHLEDWNARRRMLARLYGERLRGEPSIVPLAQSADGESAFHLYVVQVPARDTVLKRLHEAGIEAGVHYPVPLHRQRAYEHLAVPAGALPETEASAARVLSLPLYAEMSVEMVERCAATLLSVVREAAALTA